jgi:hypothetical protein
MAEVGVITANKTDQRFGRIAAAASCLLGLVAVFMGPLALALAALVCAVFALVPGVLRRDIYATAGGTVGAILALASPAVLLSVSLAWAAHTQAQQAKATQVQSDIQEVATFDAKLQQGRTNTGALKRHAEAYAKITAFMERSQDQYRQLDPYSPSRSALYSQMVSAQNEAGNLHAQTASMSSRMDELAAKRPERWARIQSLCSDRKVAKSDACKRVAQNFADYVRRTEEFRSLLARDDAAYAAEKAKQQAIMRDLS